MFAVLQLQRPFATTQFRLVAVSDSFDLKGVNYLRVAALYTDFERGALGRQQLEHEHYFTGTRMPSDTTDEIGRCQLVLADHRNVAVSSPYEIYESYIWHRVPTRATIGYLLEVTRHLPREDTEDVTERLRQEGDDYHDQYRLPTHGWPPTTSRPRRRRRHNT